MASLLAYTRDVGSMGDVGSMELDRQTFDPFTTPCVCGLITGCCSCFAARAAF